MDKLPFEIFICIIQLLDRENRQTCCRVCKAWNSNINRSYLLLESVCCNDLKNDKRIKRFFKQNQQLSNKVEVFEYNLQGKLPVEALRELPSILPHLRHICVFTNNSAIYNFVNSKGRKIAPRAAEGFVNAKNHSRQGVHEGQLNEYFEGWNATLESIQDASTNMLSSFMLNCSPQPFSHLKCLWLNYSNISISKLDSAMSYLMTGLKRAPALEEITLNYTHVSFADLDVLHQECQQLTLLRLEYVDITNHPSAPGQRFMYDVPSLHYQPTEAPCLKKLEIMASRIISGVPILSFIAAKYRHAEHIICKVSNKLENDMSDAYRDQAHALLLSCTNSLEYFDCNLFRATPSFLRLMDSQGINKIQKFDIGHEDDIENFAVLCSSDNYKAALKDLTMQIHRYPNHFNDMLLNLKNLTQLHIINTNDAAYDNEIADAYPPPDEEATMWPLNALLNELKHLETLKLEGFYITLDSVEVTQHKVKEIALNECSFESFENQEDDTLFSICNYISTCCLQLQTLTLCGDWSYDPHESEVHLKLFGHKSLKRVEVFIQYGCPYIRHLDEEGTETWYEVQRNEHYQGFEYFSMNSDKPPSYIVENKQYFTIECADPNLFYTPKVYYQEPYAF